MVAAKVSRRGQIVIPRVIRERLSLREGDRVAFVDKGGVVTIRPLTATLRDLRGSVAVDGPQDFDAIRREVRAKRASRGGGVDA